MESSVKIYLKKGFILIVLDENAKYSSIYTDIREKLKDLKRFYEQYNYPLVITGKYLQQNQQEQLKNLFLAVIGINITFKYNNCQKQDTTQIDDICQNSKEYSNTKFHMGSLRSGMRIESQGSLVIIGDVNYGSEVIAKGNIIIFGTLRGLAHAGSCGNKNAYIICKCVDTKQIRIANIIKAKDMYFNSDSYVNISIDDNSIIIN